MALQVEFRPLGGAMENNTDHMTLDGGGGNYSWGSGDTGGFITYGMWRNIIIFVVFRDYYTLNKKSLNQQGDSMFTVLHQKVLVQ